MFGQTHFLAPRFDKGVGLRNFHNCSLTGLSQRRRELSYSIHHLCSSPLRFTTIYGAWPNHYGGGFALMTEANRTTTEHSTEEYFPLPHFPVPLSPTGKCGR